MIRLRLILLSLLLFCGCLRVPTEEILKPYRADIKQNMSGFKKIVSFDDIENLGSDDFDLAYAVLYVSKLMDPSVDIDRYIDQIDTLSAKLSYYLSVKNDPKARVNTLIDFMWRNGFIAQQPYWKDFRVNEFNEMWALDYSNFVDLLKTKKGNCLTFSLLYLILSQRVGLPIHGVAIPRHVFVRYDDGSYVSNIETLAIGYFFSDDDYIKDIGEEYDSLVPFDSEFKKEFRKYYLTNLTKKEMFGCFLTNMSACLHEKNNNSGALASITLANKCNPHDPDILTGLGIMLLNNKKLMSALDVYKRQLDTNPFKAMVCHYMGLIYRALGREEDAVFYFEKALMVKPYSFSEFWYIAVSYFELGRYDEALKRFDRVLTFDNSHCRSWYYKASIFSMRDQSGRALSCLRKAINSNSVAITWAEKADYFKKLQDDKRFIKLLKKRIP